MAELSHSITMKRNWFLRLFIWFWDAKGVHLNTCLVFWGTLGMIVLWPFRLIGILVKAILTLVGRWLDKRDNQTVANAWLALEEDVNKEPSRLTRFLFKLSDLAGAFWFKFQTPITWGFRFIVGAVLLAAAAYVIYGLTTVTWSWTILWTILEFFGMIVGAVAISTLLLIVLDRRSNKPKRHLIRRMYRAVHDHTCANIVIEP